MLHQGWKEVSVRHSALACHSERSEESPHFAFAVAFAVALALVFAWREAPAE
jgi:hypothetical protein